MNVRSLLLIVMAALTAVAGNLLMRAGVLQTGGLRLSGGALLSQLMVLCRQPMFAAGACLYVMSAVIWFSVISTERLSTAYPVLVSMTFVLVTAASMVFLQERVSVIKAFGIIWMLAGIWIVSRS